MGLRLKDKSQGDLTLFARAANFLKNFKKTIDKHFKMYYTIDTVRKGENKWLSMN